QDDGTAQAVVQQAAIPDQQVDDDGDVEEIDAYPEDHGAPQGTQQSHARPLRIAYLQLAPVFARCGLQRTGFEQGAEQRIAQHDGQNAQYRVQGGLFQQ